MATYKDDLDILKAAEKDSSKLSLNAITELDNKGLLGMYGGGGEASLTTTGITIVNTTSRAEVNVLGVVYENDILNSFISDVPVSSTREYPNLVIQSMLRIDPSQAAQFMFEETGENVAVIEHENPTFHIVLNSTPK